MKKQEISRSVSSSVETHFSPTLHCWYAILNIESSKIRVNIFKQKRVTCANSEESDQTAFERSLIRLFTVCKHDDGIRGCSNMNASSFITFV